MMQIKLDRGFIDLLNERTGLNLTWEQFTAIYSERKAQRVVDPTVQVRKGRRRSEILKEALENFQKQDDERLKSG